MKKIIALIIITVLSLDAVEITVLGGYNSQTWDSPEHVVSGSGWHAGLLVEAGITPSFLPLGIGLETGAMLQQANYSWYTIYFEHWQTRFQNLLIPVLVNGNFDIGQNIHMGIGGGPALIRNLSGYIEEDLGVRYDFPADSLHTDVGLLLKGEVGIRLAPAFWLEPALGASFNSFKHDADPAMVDKYKNWFFSLRLVLRL